MSTLPIYEIDEEIVEAMGPGGRLLLSAPTGSGKSTQVPQMLLDGGCLEGGRCVVLQPRRIAARMLAARVAEERGARLGGEVGYQIRLDNVSSPETRILYVTEGILLRQMLTDPRLEGVSAIVFDEFHERHLYSDITLARALELQETLRPDLRLAVMSATLDTQGLAQYLEPCQILSSEGRTHPVEIVYLKYDAEGDPPWELAADAVAAEFDRTEGDILVFMPGAYEIARTIREIQTRIGSACPVLPLHGELPAHEQDKAVARTSSRKIIVSTNVAETSLTIEGVRVVVDSGLARVARYDPHRGINTLLIEKISKASADQRAGRAGRTAPGRCVRLWTPRAHERRAEREAPEIQRLDLAETVLALRAAGVADLTRFRWIEPPDPKALERAELLLRDLGALAPDGAITETGRRMLKFPIHPRYARMFLAAQELGCVRAAALIAALTQSRPILLRAEPRVEEERREMFGASRSDFFLLMRAHAWARGRQFRTDACRPLAIHAEAARQVQALFEQFLEIAAGEGLDTEAETPPDEAIARCILAGFADQVARRRSGATLMCDVVHGRRGLLARSSVAQGSRLLVAAEIAEIEGKGGEAQVILSLATEIEESWLREMFPGDFREEAGPAVEAFQNRVVLRRRVLFRDLVLEEREREAVPNAEVSAKLAEHILHAGLKLEGWNDACDQLLARLRFAAQVAPEAAQWPLHRDFRREVIEALCSGASAYRDVKDKPALPLLRALVGAELVSLIEHLAPERYTLPGGRQAKIVYPEEGEPWLAAKIQDLYGLQDAPKIGGGRHKLLIHILAPNYRPVQVTKDLAGFWKTQYPEVKKSLSRLYPKHEWR